METTKPFSAIQTISPYANQNTPTPQTPPNSNLSSFNDSKLPFKPKIEPAVTVTNHKLTTMSSTPPSAFPTNHTPSSSSSPNLIAQKPIQRKRRISFTLPFIKAGEAIREAGADALRGVSSISGSGGIVGSV
jgi:hypothetical protein